MALTGFMKIPDIDGESTTVTHENEIEFFGLDWRIERRGVRLGARATPGRSVPRPLTVSKYCDAASPYLAEAVHRGTAFDTITLVVRRNMNEAPLDYLTIELSDCRLSDYALSGGEDEMSPLIYEEVEIFYEKAEFSYVRQNDDGTAQPPDSVEIDRAG